MNKYVKAFLSSWGIVILIVFISNVPVGEGGTRTYNIDAPTSYSETTLRDQEALAKDFLEGKVTKIESPETFVALNPEISYLNIQVERKAIKITYLGRVRPEGPTIYTSNEISWARSYKALDAQLAGTTLTVTIRPDFEDFVGNLLTFGVVIGAMIGLLICLIIYLLLT